MISDNSQNLPELSLAIVGMAGQFPDAQNIAEFWQNLISGTKSIRAFTDEELLAAGVDPSLLENPDYIKVGTVVKDIDLFDASFFGFTPREAETMDPQTRLFLQCAWTAMEDAAYDPGTYKGLIGIFAGKFPSTYKERNLISNPNIVQLVGDLQLSSGNDTDALTTMVAYKLDLKGPCISVQTFCSTSLVALHLACQSLLAYECDMAMAGGAAIVIPQTTGYMYQEGGIFAPDGECRTFDADANGMVMGNGLGIVVLKRLEDAVKDGDHIYAVIRGSAVTNDGVARVGFTAPGVNGQSAVIAAALGNAGVDAETVSYIETHGTGTPLGDSVELRAMIKAFPQNLGKIHFCALSSVKPNIGHLDRASGVAGAIKAALSLQHKLLLPSLNYQKPNPDIDLDNSPFYVNTALRKWESNGEWPRRAGVSSFGVGGTNAHVVLEEAPELEPVSASRPYQLLLLSAKTEGALEVATSNLAACLKENSTLNLADAAYTLQVGRALFNHRRMVVCHDLEDGAEALAINDPHRVFTVHQTYRERPVAFIFPGVGDHYVGMGQELYQTELVFKEWVDRCCTLLTPYLECDLRDVIYPERDQPPAVKPAHGLDLRKMLNRQNGNEVVGPLRQTAVAQPATFVVEYALAKLLMSWGVQPKAMAGYSLGEYVAACLAGVLSLEDALMLVAKRAQMIQELAPGAMLTISLSEAELRPFLNEAVALTSILTPTLSVVAGSPEAITALQESLIARDIGCRLLPTTHAFHSPMMNPIRDDFAKLVQTVVLNAPEIPYLSNVTGHWITAAEVTDPTYWTKHLCQPVQLSSSINELLQNQEQVMLEVGPGQSMGSFIRQHPHCDTEKALRIFPTIRYGYDEQADSAFLLKTIGKLWLTGITIDWNEFYKYERRRRLPLPTYPFEQKRYWIEANTSAIQDARITHQVTGKKPDTGDWFYQPVWKQTASWNMVDVRSLDADGGIWLLFLDKQGVGALMTERLEKAGGTVIQVQAGTQFAQLSENVYSLDPQVRDDYRQLFATLSATPNHIVHLWGIDPLATSDDPAMRFSQAQQLGFYSLLFLIKGMGHYAEEISLWAVTSNAQSITGVEALCPEKATVLGECLVIPQEYLNITCHYVDIEWPQGNEWQTTWLVDQLVTEFTRKTADLTVAYRSNKRWAQTYEPLYLKAAHKTALRQNGVYLITGGLGAVGMILAGYLAETVQAKVVLTSRSAFPPPDEWTDWLTSHDPHDPVSVKINHFQSLRSRGAEIQVVQAHASDEAQMMAVVAQVEAHFGALHGVIHAAGISTDQRFFAPMQNLSIEQCEAHFGAKVYGLYVLEKVLADKELDFCILFSSLASVLGGLEFGAYAAANGFMDAFTQLHNLRCPQSWSCINWDTWRTRANMHEGMGATVAEFEMLPEEAIQALERIIANGFTGQLVNSTGNLMARLDQWVHMVSIRGTNNKAGEAYPLHPRPELMVPYAAPTNEVEQHIAKIWQDLLGIESVGIHDHFLELGGNSLIGIQVISRLRPIFQVNLSLALVLMASTVSELAIAVEMAIIDELEALEEAAIE